MTKKAIGLTEFNEFTQEQQCDLLYRDGVYIGKRKNGNLIYVLFQLQGFYVEICYKHYRRHVEGMNVTDNADILQPYIHLVTISGLDNNTE